MKTEKKSETYHATKQRDISSFHRSTVSQSLLSLRHFSMLESLASVVQVGKKPAFHDPMIATIRSNLVLLGCRNNARLV